MTVSQKAVEAAVVKPLVWSEVSAPNDAYGYDHTKALSIVGEYSIEWKSWKEFDDFTVFLHGLSSDVVGSGGWGEGGLERAKAAAQSDYEQRILSALTTPTEASAPVQPEPDAGLVEALSAASRRIGDIDEGLSGLLGRAALAIRRTQPSTAQPSQGEAVNKPAINSPAWWSEQERTNGTCAKCQGTGRITTRDYHDAVAKEQCDNCGGKGMVHVAPVDVGAAVAAEAWEPVVKGANAEWVGSDYQVKMPDGQWKTFPSATSYDHAAQLAREAAAIRQSTLGEPKEGGENG